MRHRIIRSLERSAILAPHSILAILALGFAGCAHYDPKPVSAADSAAAFDRRSLVDPGVQAYLEANHAMPTGSPREWDVDALTYVAIYYQPALAAARAHWESVQASLQTARQRPNPTVAFTPSYDNQIPGSPTPWILPVTLDIPIETAGKRGDRVEQARSMAEAAHWAFINAVWQTRSRVRSAMITLATAGQRQELLADEERAQESVERLMEEQVNEGNASNVELTQARIGLDTARLARMDGLTLVSDAQTQLALALGVPRRALDGIRFSISGPDPSALSMTEREIRGEAVLHRSDVRQALAEYAASQAALQLEVANQYPDIHLGPGYAYNTGSSGDNQWTLGLTLTLPVLNQNQGPIAEARARRQEASAHFLAVQEQAIGEVDGAFEAFRVTRERSATSAALEASLERHRDSARSMLRAGESDRLTAAAADLEYFNGALARLDTLQKAQQALGALEDAVESPAVLSDAAIRGAENISPR